MSPLLLATFFKEGRVAALAGLQTRAQIISHRSQSVDLLINALQLRFDAPSSFSRAMGLRFQKPDEACELMKRETESLHLLDEMNRPYRFSRVIPVAGTKAWRRGEQPLALIKSDRLNAHASGIGELPHFHIFSPFSSYIVHPILRYKVKPVSFWCFGHAGPPSSAVSAMRASNTAPDFESASSISPQVMPDSGIFARLDQESASPA
jgi:hypothetical protein